MRVEKPILLGLFITALGLIAFIIFFNLAKEARKTEINVYIKKPVNENTVIRALARTIKRYPHADKFRLHYQETITEHSSAPTTLDYDRQEKSIHLITKDVSLVTDREGHITDKTIYTAAKQTNPMDYFDRAD